MRNNKFIPAFFLLTIAFLDACTQDKMDGFDDIAPITFEKTFGGNEDDFGGSIEQTPEKDYIVVGSTSSKGAGGFDVYLFKTDSSGSLLWEKTFGGTGYDEGISIQKTADGGYIIVGSTSSGGIGASNLYLIKIDVDGNLIWEKTFNDGNFDGIRSVKQTSDGGFIIVWSTDSQGSAGYDVLLMKTDNAGNLVWKNTFGDNDKNIGASVQETTDGGFIITGSTGDWSSEIYIFLVKTDNAGNLLWEKTFGMGSKYNVAAEIQITPDGGYIIIGKTNKLNAGSDDILLIKTDKDGNLLWEKTFGGSRADYGYSIHSVADGGYIIVGDTYSKGAGGADVYLIKINNFGNLLWEKTFGDSKNNHGRYVQQTADGGYVIVGATYREGSEGYDIYLIKTDQEGNVY
jgi:hypothetical protein